MLIFTLQVTLPNEREVAALKEKMDELLVNHGYTITVDWLPDAIAEENEGEENEAVVEGMHHWKATAGCILEGEDDYYCVRQECECCGARGVQILDAAGLLLAHAPIQG